MSAARKIDEVTNPGSVFLQGNLQNVFDALYYLGIIDPVLEMDWDEALTLMPNYSDAVHEAIQVVNEFKGSGEELADVLKGFDEKTLGYLAMEVAREFADFHAREKLH
jgi:hypothetical protein